MYNVMIVDDEPAIREGLSMVIDWENYGFKVIDTAENGIVALHKLKTDVYQLIIVDIRMPELNGLELIKEIKKLDPNIKVIILSGYSDFSYAKQAITYGVKNYLLKPVDSDELVETITIIKLELDKEFDNSKTSKLNIDVMEEKFLFDLAYGKLTMIEILEKAKTHGMDINNKHFNIALIEINSFFDLQQKSFENANIIKHNINHLIRELIKEKCTAYVYDDMQGILGIMFISENTQLEFTTIELILKHIYLCIEQTLKLGISIGYGSTVDNPLNIKASRESAEKALDRTVIYESNIIVYDKIKDIEHLDIDIEWSNNILLAAVESNNLHDIRFEIDRFLKEIQKKLIHKNIIIALSYNIILDLIKIIKAHDGDSKRMFDINIYNDLKLNNGNIEQMGNWLVLICIKVAGYIQELNGGKSDSKINQIKKYIDENYYKELSLKVIANYFYLNNAYLGQLFKNTTGVSFHDYINKIRISKAKEMLIDGIYRSYEIIEKVGYNDADYFYRLFKRYEGITFGEYKEKIKQNIISN